MAAALFGVLTARMTEELTGPPPCAVRPLEFAELPAPPQPQPGTHGSLQVVLYNVHIGMGHARWMPVASRASVVRRLSGIAEHIYRSAPPDDPVDLVALNEVDFHSRRSAWVDQPAVIAAALGRFTGHPYRVVRGTTWTRDIPGLEVRYGNAALVRGPVEAAESCLFGGACLDVGATGVADPALAPAIGRWFGAEPRSVLRLTLIVDEHPVDVLVSHLDAFSSQRRALQAAELTRRFMRPGRTSVLLGDLNATDGVTRERRVYGAYDPTLELLGGAGLVDARLVAAAHSGAGDLSAWATFPAHRPAWPLDAVLATPDLLPIEVGVLGDGEVSDHLGLRVRYGRLGPEARSELMVWVQWLRRQRTGCAAFPAAA